MTPFMFRLLNFLLHVGMTCGIPNVCYKSGTSYLQGSGGTLAWSYNIFYLQPHIE